MTGLSTLMAYLEHFEPDVFVSYGHGDSVEGEDEKLWREWTQCFVRKVKGYVIAANADDIQIKNIHIWTDRKIDSRKTLDEELKENVSKCAILLIVMTHPYLQSNWCRKERDWFREEVEKRNDEVKPVVLLRAQKTEDSTWPEFLRSKNGEGIVGISCEDPSDSRYPLGWPKLQEHSGALEAALRKTEIEIVKALRQLRNHKKKTIDSAASACRVNSQFLSSPRRVYLHASGDCEAARADVDGVLARQGFAPFHVPPVSGGSVKEFNREAQQRKEAARTCEALTLLRASFDDERFRAVVEDVGVTERRQIAMVRRLPLPCAVLDTTGTPPPMDLAAFDIKHFDVNQETWLAEFEQWLDASSGRGGVEVAS